MVANMKARAKKRFHTSQDYARKVLTRERAKYLRNPDPLVALIASTAASGHGMLARDLCALSDFAKRMPAHIAYGFSPITAARVIFGV